MGLVLKRAFQLNILGKFRELRVWQDALDLAESIYRISSKEPLSGDSALRNQMQKAAVSLASNIAQGDERGTYKESIYFFNVAKASAAEIITQLIIAYRIGYVDDQTFIDLEDQAEKIKAGLTNLIIKRRRFRKP